MIDLIPIILTYGAMALYLITFFLLVIVIKRTRGKFKLTLTLWTIIVVISFIRRTLNLLSLTDMINNELWDDSFSIVVAGLLLFSIYTLFKEIRSLTDVELHHSREARRELQTPPPRREPYERFEREEPKRFDNDRENRGDTERRRLRVVNGYVDFTKD